MLIVIQSKEGSVCNVASTGDKATFRFARKAQIVGAKVLLLEAGASNTAFNCAFDQRITAGSDTGRTAVATLEVGASKSQGSLMYDEDAQSSTWLVDAGDEIVFEVVNACTNASHNVVPVLEFIDVPESVLNLGAAVSAG